MKKDEFKYHLYRLFFDVDYVACTFVDDMVKAYPSLKNRFEEMCWDISKADGTCFLVLSVEDAQNLILEYVNSLEVEGDRG